MLTLLYSPACLRHEPPFPHPENPRRLEIALEALTHLKSKVSMEEPTAAREADLARIHDPGYVAKIKLYVESGVAMIDADTYLSEGTVEAALAAAGAALKAAEIAFHGGAAFALVRPPGHHAGQRGRAMGAPTQGFCIFNNAALAVSRLLELGLKRVAVIDFDAHHGNGTQEIFYADPRVLHIDLHEDPKTLYPGTGFPTDMGEGEGRGFKVNIIVPPGSSDDVYSLALEEIVVPLLEEFKPEALVFSAGFDAYLDDGLTHLKAGAWTYSRLGDLASEMKVRRLAAVLEGGYTSGLEKGLPTFVGSLAGYRAAAKRAASPKPVFNLAKEYVEELKVLLRDYWKL